MLVKKFNEDEIAAAVRRILDAKDIIGSRSPYDFFMDSVASIHSNTCVLSSAEVYERFVTCLENGEDMNWFYAYISAGYADSLPAGADSACLLESFISDFRKRVETYNVAVDILTQNRGTLVKTPLGIFPSSEARERLTEAGLVVNSDTYKLLAVDVEVYSSDPEKPGYLQFVRRKAPNQIWSEVKDILHHYVPDWEGRFDYIGPPGSESASEREIPDFQFLSCFVVTGGSEGHYLHVDLLLPGGHATIILGKTFLGAQAAWDVAIAIATILGA